MQKFRNLYSKASYGNSFRFWLQCQRPVPYNSYGNGSAMRISSVAYFANTLEEVKNLSYMVTKLTHNHPEGIKGAEATAVAIWLALKKKSKT